MLIFPAAFLDFCQLAIEASNSEQGEHTQQWEYQSKDLDHSVTECNE